MWRHDPGRTAASPMTVPANRGLSWVRHLPPLKPAYRDNRLQFDAGYEPIVLGNRLFVASSRDDSVTAYDTATGAEEWKFFTNGPVRFAPVGGNGRVIFGSDDGCVYCVKASDGALVWKKRAVPSNRRVLGNGRLISVWPVRGGPVLYEDRVYFAAGVWPLEGTFVFCIDAANGDTIWRNDKASYLYGIHPHNAEAYGGLAPQGYLVIDEESGELIVPSSQAYPARFDLETGELKEFKLPAPGRLPGGWFASTPSARETQKLKRRGVIFDNAVNYRVHEDKPHFKGETGVRSRIFAGGVEWKFDDGFSEIVEPIHSMVVGDGKLFTVTEGGTLSCYAEAPEKTLEHSGATLPAKPRLEPGVFAELDIPRGFGVMLGVSSEGLAMESPLERTGLKMIGVDDRSNWVRSLRQEGWVNARYGEDFTLLEDDPETVKLPPCFASLIVIDQSAKIRELSAERLQELFQSLRPYGGTLVAEAAVSLPTDIDLPGAKWSEHPAGWTILTREGALPGSTNYTGDWAQSPDENVRGPLGVLWFDDALSHFKRSPQPKFIDGVMISTPKDWSDASTRGGGVDYRLLPPVFSDVYTGRILEKDEAPELRQSFGTADLETVQPSQYRPPRQKDDWKPEAPRAGERTNPITLETEPRVFPKSYGCDGGVDYGHLYSMRSGTPAFYDKRVESGTVNISGPRSGCTNSVIPANGLLNLPYFYDGCTCSYPLPMAVALIAMPETFEQWASWGELPAEKLHGKIQRLGLNFGAPGDRMTEVGTLWLDVPNIGGPSPAIDVITDPPLENLETFYEHSLFVANPSGEWPWVAGSGVRGLRTVRLGGVKAGAYSIRVSLASATTDPAPEIVRINGKPHPLNLEASPRPAIEGIVIGSNEALTLEFPADEHPVDLTGIEIIRTGP